MRISFISETELPGREVSTDTLHIIAHRYYWTSDIVSGKEILEVGCGPGLGLGWLSRHAKRVIGGDITGECLVLAKKHYGPRVELVHMDAHKLPFKDDSVDAVVCLASIFYMNVPVFLNECRRVLRTGGKLIINTPNKDSPSFRPSNLSRRYYSVPELYSLLNQHHFDTKFFGAFPAPKGLGGILQRFLSIVWIVACKTPKFSARARAFYASIRRLAGFANIPLREELDEEEIRLVEKIQVVPLLCDSPDKQHRILYVIAQAR